jgi:hypothetical protein
MLTKNLLNLQPPTMENRLSAIMTELENSNRQGKLIRLTFLKEIGALGKRIYALQPEPWLKDWLIKLHKYLINYKI